MFVGNGTSEDSIGVGSYQLHLRSGLTLLLHDVLHVPGIQHNLLSITTLISFGFSFEFSNNGLVIFENVILYGHGSFMDGFIKLDLNVSSHSSINSASSYVIGSNNIDSAIWHARLGHIGKDRMTWLAREGLLGSLTKVDLQLCEPCLPGKACRKPFGTIKRVAQPIELVHSDICGPMKRKARHMATYFLTLIDDYSQYGNVYLLSHRHEALDFFKRFVAEVEKKHENGLKIFRNDHGRKYLSDQFKEFCEEKGILRYLTIPCTLQQNGVAKMRDRTLLDMTRLMMVQANLSISFWGDVLLTTAYILNRVPSQSVSSTPYEQWHGKRPNLEHLCPWGSARYVHNANHKYGKLGRRARKHTFIRYPKGSKGYVMFCKHPDRGKTEVDSRDVNFIENDFPSISDVNESLDLYELEELSGVPLSSSEGGELVPQIARDSGSHSQPSGSVPLELSEPLKLCDSNRGNIPHRHFEIEGDALLCTTNEPSYREALFSPAKGELMQ